MDETIPQVPTPEPIATPPSDPRTELITKYQQLYGPPAEQPTEQPVEQPTEQPVVPIVPTVAPPDTIAETLSSLKAELAGLRTALAPKEPPPAEPAPPADPLGLLRDGKMQEFVEAVAAQAGGVATQQAVAQALEMFRVENQVTSFISDLRTQNPEIAALEQYGWLDGPIQQRVYEARQKGLIKSPTDYVKVYKEAVNAEVDKARKFVQSIRAAGKQEALTTKTEVLRATPLFPQQVSTPQQPTQEGPETVESYFAKRKAQELARKGMA